MDAGQRSFLQHDRVLARDRRLNRRHLLSRPFGGLVMAKWANGERKTRPEVLTHLCRLGKVTRSAI
jgi:hypothetical protein